MDAIFLRPQPGTYIVRNLSRLLLAVPLLVSVILASQKVLEHSRAPGLEVSNTQERDRSDINVVLGVNVIRSLPVDSRIFSASERKAPLRAKVEPDQVSQLQSVTGVSFDEMGFRGRDGIPFELEGVEIPPQDALCRRIDGVSVSCRERIAARLEILTRTHTIHCQVTKRSGRATAKCLAGKMDLADDMLRNSLVRKGQSTADI